MAPFTVLHVCMGNICRSPMAERLFVRTVRDRVATLAVGAPADDLVRSGSAGTGGWHEGEEMNPPAARQVLTRGGSVTGFAARKLRGGHVDEADLVLTATADQYDYVVALRPDAGARTFVLGEFGRLLAGVDPAALPPPVAPPLEWVRARGVAIVTAAAALREGESARPGDDLDDPWGRGDHTFQRIGDEIERVLVPFVALLLP